MGWGQLFLFTLRNVAFFRIFDPDLDQDITKLENLRF
jgi:hypothetical protein